MTKTNQPAEQIEAAPFALVFLSNLRVAKFQTKDEFHDAVRNLKEREIKFIALKYHHGAQTYLQPEVVGMEDS